LSASQVMTIFRKRSSQIETILFQTPVFPAI